MVSNNPSIPALIKRLMTLGPLEGGLSSSLIHRISLSISGGPLNPTRAYADLYSSAFGCVIFVAPNRF